MTAPAIILVNSQLGENIGAAARVMGNFGLSDLRIVAPRDGWPNPKARPMSAGAFDENVVKASVFETLEDALADLTYVMATTARPRGVVKPVTDARGAADLAATYKETAGIMFGPEAAGLSNDHVALADMIVTFPVNRQFSSLNLAQAVGVFCHAWGARGEGRTADFEGVEEPAKREDLIRMLEHLEDELRASGFFHPESKTQLMTQNIRNAFTRAGWTEQEVRTFRGAIKALAKGRGRALKKERAEDD